MCARLNTLGDDLCPCWYLQAAGLSPIQATEKAILGMPARPSREHAAGLSPIQAVEKMLGDAGKATSSWAGWWLPKGKQPPTDTGTECEGRLSPRRQVIKRGNETDRQHQREGWLVQGCIITQQGAWARFLLKSWSVGVQAQKFHAVDKAQNHSGRNVVHDACISLKG
eukprot:1150969-Pelagomonas_calceolata.AAC.5